jgi:hypothetical protein
MPAARGGTGDVSFLDSGGTIDPDPQCSEKLNDEEESEFRDRFSGITLFAVRM